MGIISLSFRNSHYDMAFQQHSGPLFILFISQAVCIHTEALQLHWPCYSLGWCSLLPLGCLDSLFLTSTPSLCACCAAWLRVTDRHEISTPSLFKYSLKTYQWGLWTLAPDSLSCSETSVTHLLSTALEPCKVSLDCKTQNPVDGTSPGAKNWPAGCSYIFLHLLMSEVSAQESLPHALVEAQIYAQWAATSFSTHWGTHNHCLLIPCSVGSNILLSSQRLISSGWY